MSQVDTLDTQKLAAYLEQHIERVELHYRTNERHSITCIIHKREVIEPEPKK